MKKSFRLLVIMAAASLFAACTVGNPDPVAGNKMQAGSSTHTQPRQQPNRDSDASAASMAVASSQAKTGSAPASSSTAITDAPLTASITKNMIYSNARGHLLADGWSPIVDAQCKENVVGGNYQKVCAAHPDRCNVCDEMPELSSCGSGGVCLMRFHNAANGKKLDLSTFGDIGEWNVKDSQAPLMVTGWEVSPGK